MERFLDYSKGLVPMARAKVKWALFVTFEEFLGSFRQICKMFEGVKRKAIREHLRLREALRERENLLDELVANSPDAILVTDDAHGILAASRMALALFGVSKKNVNKFALDTFLPRNQIPSFERHGPPFARGTERQGECTIKRFDGGVRIVEFSFQANFAPGRHLSKFRDITPLEKPDTQSHGDTDLIRRVEAK